MPLSDIQPGTPVTVKVVKQPTNAAASKTLARLLGKDPGHAAEQKRHAKVRKRAQWKSPRGGRWRVWESRLAKQRPVTGSAGESGTLTATYDVMNDLRSVERFVVVTPAA